MTELENTTPTSNTEQEISGTSEKKQEERISYVRILQYISLIVLLSLSLLGILSLTQLVFIATILDLAVFIKYENLQYSLLFLPMKLIDYLAVTKKYSTSEMKKKDWLSWLSINVKNIFGFLIISVFALSWATAQTTLTAYFLLELINNISPYLGVVVVPLLQLKIAIVLSATFLTILLLGKKNLEHNTYQNIIDNKKGKEIKVVLLGLVYFIVMGYSLEWVKYLLLPNTLAIIVTIIASLTFSLFLAKRVNATVDVIINSYYESRTSNRVMFMRLLSYGAICALVFTTLHLIHFSLITVSLASAIIVFTAIFEYNNSDEDIFRNLFYRFPLIAHGAGESLVSTSGMRDVLPGFMLPYYALILTIFEVLADSNHNHDGEINDDEYRLPNLKDMGINIKDAARYIDDETLRFCGYLDSPGVFGNKPKYEPIVNFIKSKKEKITIRQAIRLIFSINHKIDISDLLNAGYIPKEIAGSSFFSINKVDAESKLIMKICKEDLMKKLDIDSYKAKITPIMIQNLMNKCNIDAYNAGFSKDEVIDCKLFSRNQLKEAGIIYKENYSPELSEIIAIYLSKYSSIDTKETIQLLKVENFSEAEIIESKIFSKSHLENAGFKGIEDYKPELSTMISIYLSRNNIYSIKELISLLKGEDQSQSDKGFFFSDDEIIESKIFSKKQLTDEAGIECGVGYEGKITMLMLQFLEGKGGIEENLSKSSAVFSEAEIIAGNIFTRKELLNLNLESDYYSSQLSFATMLTLISVIFINYNPILLAVGIVSTLYYALRLGIYDADASLKFSRLKNHCIYYASCITAFSMGVNGGVECLGVFGCSIYIVIALAVFGAIVEGSVYFDELMRDSDAHNHSNILDYIPSLEDFILYSVLCVVGFALYNVSILLNLPTFLIMQMAIIVLPLILRANYNKIYSKVISLFNSDSREFSIASKIILVNIVFSITTTLGYSVVFMPISIPVMIVSINILLLALVSYQEVISSKFEHKISVGMIKKNICKCCSTVLSISGEKIKDMKKSGSLLINSIMEPPKTKPSSKVLPPKTSLDLGSCRKLVVNTTPNTSDNKGKQFKFFISLFCR